MRGEMLSDISDNVGLQYNRELQPPTAANKYTGDITNDVEGKKSSKGFYQIFE